MCKFDDCQTGAITRGLCNKHNARVLRHGDPSIVKIHVGPRAVCIADGCDRLSTDRELCRSHYAKARRVAVGLPTRRSVLRRSKTCVVAECERVARSLNMCSRHYWSYHKYGDPLVSKKRGSPNRARGSGSYSADGYFYRCHGDGRRIGEHRFVMEQKLGRKLLSDETVHHLNGVRSDNRPGNLELWSTRHPKGQRVSDKIAWCLEFLSRYGSVTFAYADATSASVEAKDRCEAGVEADVGLVFGREELPN